MKSIIYSEQFLNGKNRYCLWLKDATPHEIAGMPFVLERIKNVHEFRLNSKREGTKKTADIPYIFSEIKQPINGNYLFIPSTTSEKRNYVLMDFFSHDYIIGNGCSFISNASLYHFGILSSVMHTIWFRNFCGRLGTSTTYTASIVYNNFIWPESPSEKDKQNIENISTEILNIRKKYSSSTLSDLYNPLTMPSELLKAHQKLDKAVESLYRIEPFSSDDERLRFLLELYKNKTTHLTE